MADYLDELIEKSKEDPVFLELWGPKELMLELRGLRLAQGITQAEVAERMHIARPRVAEIEKHPERVSFERITAYSNALGAKLIISAPKIKKGKPAKVRSNRLMRGKEAS